MLTIGFTNKFFTLWSVTTEKNYQTNSNGQHYLSSITTKNSFIQNLSFDEDKAKEKAAQMGATNLSVDDSLRGQSRSFSTNQYFDAPKPEANQFQFGKYKFENINESDDLNYLLWYASDQNCIVAKKAICKLDSSYTLEGENLLTQSDKIKRSLLDGKRVLTAASNFNTSVEDLEHDGRAWIKVYFKPETEEEHKLADENGWGIQFRINAKNLDLVCKSYNGYEYWVPRGMRSFKKTQLTISNETINII